MSVIVNLELSEAQEELGGPQNRTIGPFGYVHVCFETIVADQDPIADLLGGIWVLREDESVWTDLTVLAATDDPSNDSTASA